MPGVETIFGDCSHFALLFTGRDVAACNRGSPRGCARGYRGSGDVIGRRDRPARRRETLVKRSLCSALALAVLAAIPAAAADFARCILPPGNFGGVPFTVNSTDQLPLYSGLTPLRDNVTL